MVVTDAPDLALILPIDRLSLRQPVSRHSQVQELRERAGALINASLGASLIPFFKKR